MPECIHGTAIARDEDGVLLLGPSGSGKSDLALRCMCTNISHPPGAPFKLVSDDRTLIDVADGAIEMKSPKTIAGCLEVRGLGILEFPVKECARLRLVVHLTTSTIERLPASDTLVEYVLGQPVRRIWLNPFEPSAPAKIALALHSSRQQ